MFLFPQKTALRNDSACGRYASISLLMITLLIGSPCIGAVTERSLTIDDILKLSDVGRAAAQPGSDRFVWEQSPPYDSLDDYGAGTGGMWQGNDYEIFTVEGNSGLPRKLFRPHDRTTYVLGDFSKDGRFLSLLAIRDGKVRMAAYDFRRRRLKEFPLSPRFPPGVPTPDWAWVDNHRLAMATYPTVSGPWQYTFRRAIGDRLTKSWAKSWMGKEASVDRYSSSSDETAPPLAGRLIILDLLSGQIRQLASGQFSGLRPSPDGRWLAAVRQSALPQSTLDQPHLDWTYARSALSVFSLTEASGEREVGSELDVLPDSTEWSPSSKCLAFFASQDGQGLREGNFWTFDPSKSLRELVPHTDLTLVSQRGRGGAQWPEHVVWFKGSLAVFARSTPGQAGRLVYEDIDRSGIVDSRVKVTSIPPHWFLLTVNSAPHDLTPGMDKVSPIPVVANGAQFIAVGDGQAWSLDALDPPARLFPWFSGRLETLANRDIHQIRMNGGSGFLPMVGSQGELAQISMSEGSPVLRIVRVPPGTSILSVADSGAALAEIGAGKGAQLALVRPAGKPQMLGKLNPRLDEIAETQWTDFTYTNPDASERSTLSGCLLLPSDYQSDQKYPLIVEVYPDRPGDCGSPASRNRFAMAAHATSYSEHLLAARGFIVFRPDSGGGISRTADGPQANLTAIVDRGVDALLAAGYGDASRVGLMGVSQGGFASLWVATQSRRYKAIVSINGWSDLANNFFEMNWSQELVPTEIPTDGGSDRYLSAAGTDFYMEGAPWQFPHRYLANSPLWHSNGISAPVLLIHSDMDEFGDTDYKLFFSSLHIQRKDAKLLLYRGEGHTPSSPANIRDMWQNIFRWFDKYLQISRNADDKPNLPKANMNAE
jgi:dienelactone hydrolase